MHCSYFIFHITKLLSYSQDTTEDSLGNTSSVTNAKNESLPFRQRPSCYRYLCIGEWQGISKVNGVTKSPEGVFLRSAELFLISGKRATVRPWSMEQGSTMFWKKEKPTDQRSPLPSLGRVKEAEKLMTVINWENQQEPAHWTEETPLLSTCQLVPGLCFLSQIPWPRPGQGQGPGKPAHFCFYWSSCICS